MHDAETLTFPLALILSRANLRFSPQVLVFDGGTFHSQQALDHHLELQRNLARLAGPQAPQYEFTLADPAEVDDAIADIHATLKKSLQSARRTRLDDARTAHADALNSLRRAQAAVKATPPALRAAATTQLEAAMLELRAADRAVSNAMLIRYPY